jgi:hypothetical protein
MLMKWVFGTGLIGQLVEAPMYSISQMLCLLKGSFIWMLLNVIADKAINWLL